MKEPQTRPMYWVASVALSVAIHVLVYSLLGNIPFLPKILPQTARVPSRVIHLSDVTLLPKPPATPVETPALAHPGLEALRPPSPGSGVGTGPASEDRYRPSLPEKVVAQTEIPNAPAILQIDGDRLPPERAKFNRLIIPLIPREPLAAPPATGGGPAVPSIPLDMRVSPPTLNVPPQLPATPETRLLPPEKLSILDQLIDIRIFKQPLPEGGGFFRIDLAPRERAERLQSWRKDVIFVLDVSGSISQAKLNEFKDGVGLALAQLAAADRFEIVAFRHREYALFGELRPPTKENLKAADDFLYRLQRVGTTNVYAALQPVANSRLKTPGRPLLIFLCSDGQVNTGEIVDSRELINAISNQNRDAVSLFTFDAGGFSNPFLMELLSYRNRGESLQTGEVPGSREILRRFINQVADVVVADLDYQVSSDLAADTFPKRLPHLYRGHTLSVYGRYPAGVNEIGLRITGLDSAGNRQELVYRGDLDAAGAVPANAIVRNWALQRIYHLYSRFTATGDANLRQEIQTAAKEYDLRTPYLDSYLAPRRKVYVE